jgi:lipoprotein-releasing system ATP-binding protein
MSETDTVEVEVAAAAVEEKPEPNPVLFLHDVERTYRQGDETLNILRGAELAIWPGQSVALVAPSGAGKSTL